jgi:hypothetical protein
LKKSLATEEKYMSTPRRLLARFLVIAITCSLFSSAFAAPQRRARRQPVVPVATSITFDPVQPVLSPKDKPVKVKATVLDQTGRAMPDAKVTWEAIPQGDNPLLSFSRALNESEVNTLVITAGAGNPSTHEKITTRVLAYSGEAQNDLLVTYESTPKPPPAKITFTPEAVKLPFDGEQTVTATVLDAEGKTIKGSKLSWEVLNPDLREFVKIGAVVNDDKTNSVTIFGRAPKDKKVPDVITLVAKAGDDAVGALAVTYTAPPNDVILTSWSVLPNGIVGDNFGRTIRDDYYCIQVTIDNHSDSDIALGSLSFELPAVAAQAAVAGQPATVALPAVVIPTSYYPVVQGSLARRKLTHPRPIVMATIDAMGSLLTGFNPFFHNINHAKNYSQFIDILSNPLAKGVASVWQDPYPDEMARFTANVLKDDKIIKKDDKAFKTIVFIEKRQLYPKGTKTVDDPIAVKRILGRLIVMGQKIQQGNSQDLTK